MRLRICEDRESLGKAAAGEAVSAIRHAIVERGTARIIAASAASQLEFLESLTSTPDVQWDRVELFHLDEYIGLPPSHPASFCRFLEDRLIAKTGLTKLYYLRGDQDPGEVIRRANDAIRTAPIDVAFVGIGENGHLAFNDPPADFETEAPFIIVDLDEACRRQQVGEGWFPSLKSVPTRALSMSVRQVMKSREILAIVPGRQKAEAIRACLEGPVSSMAPASILRMHSNATVYLDRESAALLRSDTVRALTSAVSAGSEV